MALKYTILHAKDSYSQCGNWKSIPDQGDGWGRAYSGREILEIHANTNVSNMNIYNGWMRNWGRFKRRERKNFETPS